MNSLDKKSLKEICDKWKSNKTINPITNKIIKENGATYKKFQELCYNTTDLFANRVSADINTRINYYYIIKDYINKINQKHKYNCIKFYKLDKNEIQYSLGKYIILHERLGKGSYGIVYKAYFRPSEINKREYGKQFSIVIKVCEITDANKLEIDILLKLSNLMLKHICPHFPFSYGYFTCKKESNIISNITSAQSSNVLYDRTNSYFNSNESSDFINKPNVYLQVNEYANNTVSKTINTLDINHVINIIIQSFISMVFFQRYINMAHHDTHGNNFLIHFIKPGGFFHYRIYNENYYLENIGYLVVINDFGLVKYLNNYTLLYDFKKFIKWFIRHKAPRDDFDDIKQFMKRLITRFTYNEGIFYKYLFKFIHSTYPKFLLTSKPNGALIINKTPYIIE
jgi:hypothetical protein